jgi:hypothetical protein
MHSAEVVVRHGDRDHRLKVDELFGEGIRQAREPAHLHPPRPIRTLITNNRADFADIPGLRTISEAPAPPLPKTQQLKGLDPSGPAAE